MATAIINFKGEVCPQNVEEVVELLDVGDIEEFEVKDIIF